MKLIVATNNEHKLSEIRAILGEKILEGIVRKVVAEVSDIYLNAAGGNGLTRGIHARNRLTVPAAGTITGVLLAGAFAALGETPNHESGDQRTCNRRDRMRRAFCRTACGEHKCSSTHCFSSSSLSLLLRPQESV